MWPAVCSGLALQAAVRGGRGRLASESALFPAHVLFAEVNSSPLHSPQQQTHCLTARPSF